MYLISPALNSAGVKGARSRLYHPDHAHLFRPALGSARSEKV
jgi:hypothetical protein